MRRRHLAEGEGALRSIKRSDEGDDQNAHAYITNAALESGSVVPLATAAANAANETARLESDLIVVARGSICILLTVFHLLHRLCILDVNICNDVHDVDHLDVDVLVYGFVGVQICHG